MSDSSDDELLRLAQYGDKGSSSRKKGSSNGASRKRPASFDSDDDSDDGAANGASADEPYPLEGKYRDAEDRRRILAMSEIERESILYERDQEIVAIREKARLNARLREQQAARQKQDAAAASNAQQQAAAKRKPTAQQSALSQLRKKREAKVNKRTYSSSEESEDDADAEEEEEDNLDLDDDDDRFRQDRSQRDSRDAAKVAAASDPTARDPLSFADASSIRITRKQVAKFLYYPMFADTVRDCFVRIAIGQDVYRVCQVKSLVKTGRTYRLPDGEPCAHVLECAHAHSSRRFDIVYVSDSAFTEREFDHWREGMEKDGLQLPRKYQVKLKLEELQAMNAYIVTDKDIDNIVAERRTMQRKPGNPAQEKIRLNELLTEARERGDIVRADELENELAKLKELAAGRVHTELDKMSKLNERNRAKNTISISKAEVAMARGAEAKSGSDPFSRFKTRPKTFYQSQPDLAALAAGDAPSSQQSQDGAISSGTATDNPASAGSAAPSPSAGNPIPKQRMAGVDQMVASIEVDLDL